MTFSDLVEKYDESRDAARAELVKRVAERLCKSEPKEFSSNIFDAAEAVALSHYGPDSDGYAHPQDIRDVTKDILLILLDKMQQNVLKGNIDFIVIPMNKEAGK